MLCYFECQTQAFRVGFEPLTLDQHVGFFLQPLAAVSLLKFLDNVARFLGRRFARRFGGSTITSGPLQFGGIACEFFFELATLGLDFVAQFFTKLALEVELLLLAHFRFLLARLPGLLETLLIFARFGQTGS